jgi:hypothetical protein
MYKTHNRTPWWRLWPLVPCTIVISFGIGDANVYEPKLPWGDIKVLLVTDVLCDREYETERIMGTRAFLGGTRASSCSQEAT